MFDSVFMSSFFIFILYHSRSRSRSRSHSRSLSKLNNFSEFLLNHFCDYFEWEPFNQLKCVLNFWNAYVCCEWDDDDDDEVKNKEHVLSSLAFGPTDKWTQSVVEREFISHMRSILIIHIQSIMCLQKLFM
jgi:hypothetical protein